MRRMKRLASLLQSEAGSALPLLAGAVLALVLANSPFDWVPDQLLATKLTVAFGTLGLSKPLLLWINDGLMAVFFLLVGLEIRREVAEGDLSSWDRAALPAVGAIGGIAVPAALKIFLLALAIIDDLGAIIIIALFYTEDLSLLSLALAGAGVLMLAILN